MSEGDFPSMQVMALVAPASAVEGIANHGMGEVFQVDADLVRSASAGAAFDEGLAFARGEHAVVCERIATALVHSHLLSVNFVSADRDINFPMRHAGRSLAKGQVGFFHSARGELIGNRSVGFFSFGMTRQPDVSLSKR